MNTVKVLLIEDDNALKDAIEVTLLAASYEVSAYTNAEEALSAFKREHFDAVITDVHMAGMNGHDLLINIRQIDQQVPVLLMTAYGNVVYAVKAMRSGATDYLEKPFAPEVLVSFLERHVTQSALESGPIIEDPESVKLFRMARRVAETQASVMLMGPSGSGKEVVARYIHDHSTRKNHPYVAINCAAIPENMLEATLFGYEKGAFTGAHQACPGKFEQAQKGTLLLDEVSEMPLNLQAKLLRVLQEREVERIGSKQVIQLDVRVIATTNRDLKSYVDEGEFREDLYYRLNVFPIKTLALTERKQDIIPLATALLDKHVHRSDMPHKVLSEQARQALVNYSWPGNVRELDNVIQRAMVLSHDHEITESDLQIETVKCSKAQENDSLLQDDLRGKLKNQEFDLIARSLSRYQGKRTDVAEELGISPRTLRYKLAKMRELGYEV